MNFLDVRYRYDDPSEYGLIDSLRDTPPDTDRARSHLLANSVRITPALFPSLAAGLKNLGEAMLLQDAVDCFVTSDPTIQAYCIPHRSATGERFTVVLSSALVEKLRIDEIRFVIGHEVGHFICGHWRYPSERGDGSLGDRLATLQLSRAAEISADRIGMLASRSLEHACAAMIKVAAGLGEPYLHPDIPSILLQFRELARGEGSESAIWTTHPIIPLRVRALLHFEPAYRNILLNGSYVKEQLSKIDGAVEADFHKSSGFALKKLSDRHLELARVWGLVALFAADGVISKVEQDLLKENLGAEMASKVMRFLKLQSGSLEKTVQTKLIEACETARLAPLSDRKSLLKAFQSLIEDAGIAEQATQKVFANIAALLETK